MYVVLAVLLAVTATVGVNAPVDADTGNIEVKLAEITSEFPDGFRIKAKASGDNEIKEITLRMKFGQQTKNQIGYLCNATGLGLVDWRCDDLKTGKVVDGEIFWRTNDAQRYVPPGTIITYRIEFVDSQGNRVETDPKDFIYWDARPEFLNEDGTSKWKEVSGGPITVAYHGPVKTRAEKILNAILQTLDTMGPVLGAGTEDPIRVNMYNNDKEMLGALPPNAASIRRELITEGQAFDNFGTLLVLGEGTLAEGSASHEVTHILVHRAGDSSFRMIPSWLQEGLSEYGNVQPGLSYEIALDFAIATNRILPITQMDTLPGTTEDVIIFYGQARSMIRMMVNEFGPEKMAAFMAAHKGGKKVDEAMVQVYGLDRVGMDKVWREKVGAQAASVQETEQLKPTPVALPQIGLFSLTPQAGSESIGGATEEPTATPTPEPAPTPVQAAVVPPSQEEPAPAEGSSASGASGTCGAPLPGASASVDISSLALLIGVAAVGLRRRRHSRP